MVNQAEIEILAVDKVTNILKQIEENTRKAGRTIEGVNKKTEQSFSKLDTVVQKIRAPFDKLNSVVSKFGLGASLGIAAVTFKLTQFASASFEAARAMEPIRSSFQRLALDSDNFLRSLNNATKGTVSNFELMSSANKALLLGIDQEALPKLFKNAAVIAQATGRTTTEALADISLGIGRQSKLILDNLGIIVDVEKANKDYADSIGKTSSQLSDMEQKTAFLNAVMKATDVTVTKLGGNLENNLNTKLQRANKQWDDFKVKSGEALAILAAPVLVKITDFLDNLTSDAKDTTTQLLKIKDIELELNEIRKDGVKFSEKGREFDLMIRAERIKTQSRISDADIENFNIIQVAQTNLTNAQRKGQVVIRDTIQDELNFAAAVAKRDIAEKKLAEQFNRNTIDNKAAAEQYAEALEKNRVQFENARTAAAEAGINVDDFSVRLTAFIEKARKDIDTATGGTVREQILQTSGVRGDPSNAANIVATANAIKILEGEIESFNNGLTSIRRATGQVVTDPAVLQRELDALRAEQTQRRTARPVQATQPTIQQPIVPQQNELQQNVRNFFNPLDRFVTPEQNKELKTTQDTIKQINNLITTTTDARGQFLVNVQQQATAFEETKVNFLSYVDNLKINLPTETQQLQSRINLTTNLATQWERALTAQTQFINNLTSSNFNQKGIGVNVG